MEVFETYRMYGVCILFFGGAVRQALLENSMLALKDVDVIYGASPQHMLAVMREVGIGPVSQPHTGKVQWGQPSGRSEAMMEGAPMCPNYCAYAGDAAVQMTQQGCRQEGTQQRMPATRLNVHAAEFVPASSAA